MRQHHVAGEKAFVDYSGKRIVIIDPTTGEIREAEIFVGVLGASNLTYAEATWTQALPDWTGAHVRMFRFFGGAPRLLVPDNLKSGVAKASFYDPEINRTYGAMAAHYSVGVLPARPYKPRDKAKVEAGVRFAQTYILGQVHGFLYSVPHALIRAEVEARVTERIVEVFHRGQRVAVHQRRYMGRRHGTTPEHMPSSHRRYAEWTPERFRRWAGKIGPNTEGLIAAVLASRPHPEQGFRTCLGIERTCSLGAGARGLR
jgi:transposase